MSESNEKGERKTHPIDFYKLNDFIFKNKIFEQGSKIMQRNCRFLFKGERLSLMNYVCWKLGTENN
jgi:hypothetical protein